MALSKSYFNNARIAIIVYDLKNANYLNECKKWIDHSQESMQ